MESVLLVVYTSKHGYAALLPRSENNKKLKSHISHQWVESLILLDSKRLNLNF